MIRNGCVVSSAKGTIVDYFFLLTLKLCSNESSKSYLILFPAQMSKHPSCLEVGLTCPVDKTERS